MRRYNRPIQDQDGNWTFAYKCPACEDEGIRHVVDDQTVKAFEAGKLFDRDHNPTGGPYAATTCVVACTCEAGTARLRMVHGVRYDEQQHLERLYCVPGIPQLYERLAAFASRSADEKYAMFLNPDDYPGRLA